MAVLQSNGCENCAQDRFRRSGGGEKQHTHSENVKRRRRGERVERELLQRSGRVRDSALAKAIRDDRGRAARPATPPPPTSHTPAIATVINSAAPATTLTLPDPRAQRRGRAPRRERDTHEQAFPRPTPDASRCTNLGKRLKNDAVERGGSAEAPDGAKLGFRTTP